jgi:hypothetical protein
MKAQRIVRCLIFPFVSVFFIIVLDQLYVFQFLYPVVKYSRPDQKLNREGEFSVVVSTYDRDKKLIINTAHWLTCPHVKDVHVIWHNPKRAPVLDGLDPRVQVHQQSTDRITNRFRLPSSVTTDAIFSVDDDVAIDCRLIISCRELLFKL